MLPANTCPKDIDTLLRVLTDRGWNPLFKSPQNRRENRKEKPLTDRQRKVLMLIGEGLNEKEIATRLSISLATVEYHKSSIRNKLNLHSISAWCDTAF
jgi:DNA-binding NarL/FixJ family response regulator